MRVILDKMTDFRDHEYKRLKNNPELTIGDVTTVNLTQIYGGIQNNVVPPELSLGFDVRIAIDVDMSELEQKVHNTLN